MLRKTGVGKQKNTGGDCMAGFHEIIGHEQLIAHLQSAIVMDKVSHAYIINGPKDSGKIHIWRMSILIHKWNLFVKLL